MRLYFRDELVNGKPPRKRRFSRRLAIARAVEWIAQNDEPGDFEIDVVETYISTQVAADMLGMSPRSLAQMVVRRRRVIASEEG